MRIKSPRRLIAAMQWVAILSTSEAEACIRDLRAGSKYSGEAVNHFGGTQEVLKNAYRVRHMMWRERAFIRSVERTMDRIGARSSLEMYNLTHGAL